MQDSPHLFLLLEVVEVEEAVLLLLQPLKRVVIIELEEVGQVVVTIHQVMVVNEYLYLGIQALADITLLEELNTYATDTVYIALLLTEL